MTSHSESLDPFRLFARYNQRANERLYAAASKLDAAALNADRGAFFGSILATLNHLLVGDRIWMARFEGGDAPSTGLDAILYPALPALAEARAAEDARIIAFMDTLPPTALAGPIAYVNNAGDAYEDPLALLLPHFFNHQTHHRGQVHAMLTAAGQPSVVLDLHRVLKPTPESPFPPAG